MSFLHCLRLLANSVVQRILCCIYILFFFVLCNLCCQFVWIVLFWLPLRYSLTFIYTENKRSSHTNPTKNRRSTQVLLLSQCLSTMWVFVGIIYWRNTKWHISTLIYILLFTPDCKLLCPSSPESLRLKSIQIKEHANRHYYSIYRV